MLDADCLFCYSSAATQPRKRRKAVRRGVMNDANRMFRQVFEGIPSALPWSEVEAVLAPWEHANREGGYLRKRNEIDVEALTSALAAATGSTVSCVGLVDSVQGMPRVRGDVTPHMTLVPSLFPQGLSERIRISLKGDGLDPSVLQGVHTLLPKVPVSMGAMLRHVVPGLPPEMRTIIAHILCMNLTAVMSAAIAAALAGNRDRFRDLSHLLAAQRQGALLMGFSDDHPTIAAAFCA